MPGLAGTRARVSDIAGRDSLAKRAARLGRLDKSLQCSSWDHRPLSAAQVAYAALDAWILLPLATDAAPATVEGARLAAPAFSDAPLPTPGVLTVEAELARRALRGCVRRCCESPRDPDTVQCKTLAVISDASDTRLLAVLRAVLR